MCARHDITIGRHLFQVEPTEGAERGTYLLYITVSDLSSGDEEWKGCVRFWDGPLWEALVYGGSPLIAECHTDEVESV